MATIWEALGISTQRRDELLRLFKKAVAENNSISSTLRAIQNADHLTPDEAMYLSFLYGQFDSEAKDKGKAAIRITRESTGTGNTITVERSGRLTPQDVLWLLETAKMSVMQEFMKRRVMKFGEGAEELAKVKEEIGIQ